METKDELTGLYSRSTLLEKLDQALVECTQKRTRLVLVVMDIDHFKPFNDTQGHQAGDAAIQALARRFQETFQPDGLVGRYGGDEFLAAVVTDQPNAVLEKGEELCRSVAQSPATFLLEGVEITCPCTLSLGMAIFPTDETNSNGLIDLAKQALYRAKEAGGKSIYLYEQRDGLTGLLNRNAILHTLEGTCARALKERENVSLVLVDIDHFAELNETYGHRFGDELLKRTASILLSNLGEANSVGRYGGDEFMVVLPDCRADTAFVLAEEVRKLVADSEMVISIGRSSQTVRASVSGGVATLPGDANDPVDLIRKADEAVYRAKRSGRNRMCLPSSAQMITKTSYYTQTQLERLAALAKQMDKSEAFLLREALDDLFRKYAPAG
jgi:diguanylate cyclase